MIILSVKDGSTHNALQPSCTHIHSYHIPNKNGFFVRSNRCAPCVHTRRSRGGRRRDGGDTRQHQPPRQVQSTPTANAPPTAFTQETRQNAANAQATPSGYSAKNHYTPANAVAQLLRNPFFAPHTNALSGCDSQPVRPNDQPRPTRHNHKRRHV